MSMAGGLRSPRTLDPRGLLFPTTRIESFPIISARSDDLIFEIHHIS
jgi:hypothetical protein